MKKSGFPLPAVLLCFCVLACKTLPPEDSAARDAEPGSPVERTEPGETGDTAAVPEVSGEDLVPGEDLIPGEEPVPEEEDAPEVSAQEYPPDYFEEVLAEPASDLAELSFPEAAPAGESPDTVLPEPVIFPEEAEAAPPDSAEPPAEPAGSMALSPARPAGAPPAESPGPSSPGAPAEIPPAAAVPPPPPGLPSDEAPPAGPSDEASRQPPAAPRFIRPAEPEPPPPPAREPPQMPPDSLPDAPARIPPIPAEEQPLFSRSLSVMTGQILEIPFRGTGWVYLGDLQSRRGISYVSRRLDPEGQSFILRADAPGTFELKFYKQDFIRDYILNDYVRIVVSDSENPTDSPSPAVSRGDSSGESPEPAVISGGKGRVVAEPRWPPLEESETGPPPAAGEQALRPAAGESPDTGPGPAGESPDAGHGPAGAGYPAPEAPAAATTTAAAAGSSGESAGGIDAGTPPPAGDAPKIPAGGAAEVAAAIPPAAGPIVPPPRLRPGLRDDGIVPVLPPADPGSPAPAGGAAEQTGEGSGEYAGYLRRAREEYQAGRIPAGIAILDEARQRYPWGSDEAWWLYGQMLEANSPRRDIRSALEYYRRLIREYPQSPRYADAQRRIAYLERYYFNIQ